MQNLTRVTKSLAEFSRFFRKRQPSCKMGLLLEQKNRTALGPRTRAKERNGSDQFRRSVDPGPTFPGCRSAWYPNLRRQRNAPKCSPGDPVQSRNGKRILDLQTPPVPKPI